MNGRRKLTGKAVLAFFLIACLVGLAGCEKSVQSPEAPADTVQTGTDEEKTSDKSADDVHSEQEGQTSDTEPGTKPEPRPVSEESEIVPPETEPQSLEVGLNAIGNLYTGDLDGDGQEEEIYVEIVPERYTRHEEAHLLIDGTDFFESVIGKEYGDNPCEDNFYIAKLSPEEDWLAVGLLYDGPSADPITQFYRYESGKLEFLGAPEGYPTHFEGEYSGLYVDEQGVVHTGMDLAILQTWSAPVEWRLNEQGKLELTEQEVYYPDQPDPEFLKENPHMEIHLLCRLPVYAEPGDRNAEKTMMQPQTVKLTATDNKNWCKVEGEDGSSGWFYLEEGDFIPDLEKSAWEVFENLHYAG